MNDEKGLLDDLKTARRILKRLVKLSETGHRVGEDHQRATLTDLEVENIRTLAEEGYHYGIIADVFEVSKHTVGRICRYERRNTTFVATKAVHITEGESK